jgi:uncharacterized paraquat-inducible protein A
MKKTLMIFALIFGFSAMVMSCKGDKKEQVEESEMMESPGVHNADMAMAAEYQCPMDCEEGKTYDKEGKCPVCKMDLKKKESEEDQSHDEGAHEDHDESHN